MSEVLIYTTDDGATKVDLHLDQGSVWLSQQQIATLFEATKQNISLHLKNIFAEGELTAAAVVKESLTTATDGKAYRTKLYNLDAILAVGYRVRSPGGVQFRRYASTVLKEYMEKGFALNDERLKNLGGGNFWKELLDRIRDIAPSPERFGGVRPQQREGDVPAGVGPVCHRHGLRSQERSQHHLFQTGAE